MVKRKFRELHNENKNADSNLVRLLADVCAVAARVKYSLHHLVYCEKPLFKKVKEPVKQLDVPFHPVKQQCQQLNDPLRPKLKRQPMGQVWRRFLKLPEPLQQPFLYTVVFRLLLLLSVLLFKHGLAALAVRPLLLARPVRNPNYQQGRKLLLLHKKRLCQHKLHPI